MSAATLDADSESFHNGMKLRITGSLDLVHRLEFLISGKHNVSETGFVSIFRSVEGATYSFGSLRKS
jgi:hypothetical protein